MEHWDMTIVFKVATQRFPLLTFPLVGRSLLVPLHWNASPTAAPGFQQILLCCTIKIKLQREVKLWLTPLIAEPSNHMCLFTQQKSEKVPNKHSCKLRWSGAGLFYMLEVRSMVRSQHMERQQAIWNVESDRTEHSLGFVQPHCTYHTKSPQRICLGLRYSRIDPPVAKNSSVCTAMFNILCITLCKAKEAF